MCLEIFVQIPPDTQNKIGAKRLSEISGLHISKQKFAGKPAFHFSATGGCSCDFLAEGADVDAPVWALAEEHLAALAQALEALGKESKKFTFIARWFDAPAPTEIKKLSVGAMFEMLKANRVGNNVLYKVG